MAVKKRKTFTYRTILLYKTEIKELSKKKTNHRKKKKFKGRMKNHFYLHHMNFEIILFWINKKKYTRSIIFFVMNGELKRLTSPYFISWGNKFQICELNKAKMVTWLVSIEKYYWKIKSTFFFLKSHKRNQLQSS